MALACGLVGKRQRNGARPKNNRKLESSFSNELSTQVIPRTSSIGGESNIKNSISIQPSQLIAIRNQHAHLLPKRSNPPTIKLKHSICSRPAATLSKIHWIRNRLLLSSISSSSKICPSKIRPI
ncbi:hypothetical protein PGTUg99_026093 [Puccinia graminis f. sp. tritici]|uniref:Uncharacterized protein n=1 Tax=Puccinia graminis f. sp. tritici TaxID=56615 RepID=A0A5B0S6X8_PUCGR|nr:hypothetical protein PGTUg99_026093 [Puccinia graminis f. sp. tritici]